jgi:oligopeptide transport system ATP-binding protein
MYAGAIVEAAEVHEFYAHPLHPYSLGLLASLPRLDETEHEKLTPIEGLPPDLLVLPDGCPFYPRCRYHIAKCLDHKPVLREVGPKHHRIACWVDVTTGGEAK